MFTGIIEAIGLIQKVEIRGERSRLFVSVKKLPKRVRLGSSLAVNGVCLTVAAMKENVLAFDIMAETVKKTTIANWKKGDQVNVEPSLRIGDEVGGHFVFGHVDRTIKMQNAECRMQSCELTFERPRDIKRYIIPQGSVAIDGVSLTVARVGRNDFTVSLVDFTLRHTTLGRLQKGDMVNVECDMLAKYASGN